MKWNASQFRVVSVTLSIVALAIGSGGCGGGKKGGGGSGNCLDRGCKISASDSVSGENFGSTVSVRGNIVVVGAPFDAERGIDSGSAYVYRAGRRGVDLVQKITAGDAAEGDTFGRSVAAASENRIVIGSWDDDDRGEDSGSVYVFHVVGEEWVEAQKLVAPDGDEGDRFGRSVDADGDLIVVGADLDEANGPGSGSAYVFRLIGGTWTFEQKLTASDGAAGDDYADTVAIDGDVIVIGAGNDDDRGEDSGSVYVYRQNSGTWIEETKLTAFDGVESDEFGDPVAIHGNLIVIGADDDDDAGENSGSAYVYRFASGVWALDQKLTASDGQTNDDFGESVAVFDDMIVIGAPGDDDDGSSSGSAYVYLYESSAWVEDEKLTARDARSFANFGTAVAVDGSVLVVGAKDDDGRGDESGAAYVFEP